MPPEDYPGFKLLAAGSGFVVDAKGEVLTCLNALKQPDGSMPDLLDVEANDGSRMIAEIVGSEPTVNLAIVQCTVFPTGKSQLVPLRFGDSDALETGHWVLGFGDPSGPDKFLGTGTFIALPTRDCYQDYLSAFFLQVAMVPVNDLSVTLMLLANTTMALFWVGALFALPRVNALIAFAIQLGFVAFGWGVLELVTALLGSVGVRT